MASVTAAEASGAGGLSSALQAADSPAVERAVSACVREMVGDAPRFAADFNADAALQEVGVDSLVAAELRARLAELSAFELSPTLVAEQPTARAIADHLVALASAAPAAAAAPAPGRPAGASSGERGGQPTLEPTLLMLHGEASCASLLERVMSGMGWCDPSLGVTFVFCEARDRCPPRPALYPTLVAAGLYERAEYCSWGTEQAKSTASSLAYLSGVVQDRRPDGVAGICAGSAVAALLAIRHPEQLRFYLNFCGAPLAPLEYTREQRLVEARVGARSMHVFGQSDELYVFDPHLVNRRTPT